MSPDLAIRAENLGKQYELGELRGGYAMLSEVIAERLKGIGKRRPDPELFWALRHIDFEVPEGETLGVVGHNGAGKSTLLKLLSRVTPPTEGEIRLRGRVGALLEVGTGFHPELTGRENVFLNGAILGMTRAETETRFDEIVEFADVSQFLDTPVKRYSSGMQLRLAFAVAAHLEPEVLIVDEVLSVGDLAFQRKCLGRMEAASQEGRTVLFVSHNLTAVRNLCDRALLLSDGRAVVDGDPSTVIDEYVHRVTGGTQVALADRADRSGSQGLRFVGFRFESGGRVVDSPVTGQELDLLLSYETKDGKPLKNVNFGANVMTHFDEVLLFLNAEVTGVIFDQIPGRGEVRCHLDRCPLPAGQYLLTLWSDIGGQPLDWVQRAVEFTVSQGDFYGSGREPPESHRSVMVDQRWMLSGTAVEGSTTQARPLPTSSGG